MLTQMETLLNTESKPEAEEVIAFINTLDQDEGKEMLAFVRGVKFGRSLSAESTTAAKMAAV